ncbi:hypothetical protein ACVWZZ_002097 [Bradyrhizobium sp. LM6.10]
MQEPEGAGAACIANYIGGIVPPDRRLPLRKVLILFLLLMFVPIGVSAGRYYLRGDGRGNWQTADRSSAGLLPSASADPDALIRVFAARTARWRSIFAVHTWIVVKEKGAATYSRYDYTRPGATRFAATALRPTAAGSAPCRKRWSRSTARGPKR